MNTECWYDWSLENLFCHKCIHYFDAEEYIPEPHSPLCTHEIPPVPWCELKGETYK